VALHEEEDGKLFPDTNRSRTVLNALLDEIGRVGAELHSSQRVIDVTREDDAFFVVTADRRYRARAVVLATGGRSLPKTGSNGFGYELARRFGHGYVETTPALAPLLLGGERHARLSGISHPAALTIRAAGTNTTVRGPLLWTHFGASGPVVLNASRHWHRARLQENAVDVRLSLSPEDDFESLDDWMRRQERERPRALVSTALATRLPSAVATIWAEAAGLRETTCAHLSRDARRRLVRELLESRLEVRDSRGYNFAEVTAGGIPLTEIDSSSMESLMCPGLYLVGEILDVDGRLGGFNFQWAWSSAWVAAHAISRALTEGSGRAGGVAPNRLFNGIGGDAEV
jgi:predicted Rossmann fold flavoprotein